MANEILKWNEDTLNAIVRARDTGAKLAGRFTGDVLKNLRDNYAAAIANVILVLSALFSSLQFVGGESEKPKRLKRKGGETHV